MKVLPISVKVLSLSLILTLGLTNCEERKNDDHIVTKDKEGNTIADYELENRGGDTIAEVNPTSTEAAGFRERLKSETKEVDSKLEALRAKAKKLGKKVDEKTTKAIESFEAERKSFDSDSTGEEIEAKWDKFKLRVNNAVDSLDKRM